MYKGGRRGFDPQVNPIIDLCDGISTSSFAELSIESPQHQFGLSQLFQNELISDKIIAYLNLSDLKAISEVSSGLSGSIRNSSKFREYASLLINHQTFKESFVVESTQPWKNIKISLVLPVDVGFVDIIAHLLEHVQTLQVQLLTSDETVVEEVQNLSKILTFILTNSPSLRTLQIESGILENVLEKVFRNFLVKAQLSKIRSLEIFAENLDNNETEHTIGVDEDFESYQKNILHLSLIPFLALETFKIGKIATILADEAYHVKFIPKLVLSNKESLIELSLHLAVWKLNKMKSIRCRNLKRLTITASEGDAAVVIAFLNNQPLLEELTVDMKEGFPYSLLSAIKGKCSKLKKLHLKGKYFTGISGAVDFGFLSGMELLEDFSINRPLSFIDRCGDRYGNGMTFLNLLPHSLKKLSLRGLNKFWYGEPAGGGISEAIAIPQRILLLQHFENLTELKLMRCEDAFTDEIMQLVCKEYRNLKVLEISHCKTLTDFGITGICYQYCDDGLNSGISLKNLKGLKKLKIRACPLVTLEGLLEAVALPFLQTFDYFNGNEVRKDFIFSIVKQNPSLESISIFESELDNGQDISDELKKTYRRLRGFGIDNLNYGQNVDEWVNKDSDSDADFEISSSEEDSDESCINVGRYRLDGELDLDYYYGHFDEEYQYGYDSSD